MMRIVAVLVCILASPTMAQQTASTPGEMVYRMGALPSGQALRDEREAGIMVEGAGAACVTCHRRSGLGMTEGPIIIPPITGTRLFRPRGKQKADMDSRYVSGRNIVRAVHTEVTVVRANCEGVGLRHHCGNPG